MNSKQDVIPIVIADIYCRVSTAEQAAEGYSITEQEERLRKYVEAQGWILNRAVVDPGFSGASINRPGIQQIIRDAKNHDINKVVVYKLDRLSRSQKDTLYLIEDVFLKNHVDFVSMTESLDTSSPFGMAMIGILSVFAQLERETIKERMSIGKDAMVKAGKYRGGGFVPTGFRYIDHKLILDEYEASVIREIFQDYANGVTANQIANKLNHQYHFRQETFTSNKVKKLLKQPLYICRQRWKGEEVLVEDCPRMVSDELFFDVQREIARRTKDGSDDKPQSPHNHTTLLGGLLWCGCCGARFAGCSDKNTRTGKKIFRYYCYSRLNINHGKKAPHCTARSWNSQELNTIVLNEISKISTDKNMLHGKMRNTAEYDVYNERKKAINDRIAEIDSAMERLVDLYAIGSMNAAVIAKRSDALQQERNNLIDQLENIKQPSGMLSESEVQEELTTFKALVDTASEDAMELYNIVHRLIKSVTVTDETVDIRWNFQT